ncbi:MAG: F0F1 ATP synthase subunit delta [Proteobacteria bacterium]|nr:F0F1 ATP synthase subunit delta [Pseudomonadota bacterium]
MSSNALTLARPYARAAFALACERKALPLWSVRLGFAASIAADPRVQALLGNPGLTVEDAVALVAPPGPVDPDFVQFLTVLADNGRMAVLPDIAAIFAQLRAESERVIKATITSATVLDEAELAKLRAALTKRLGSQVEIATAVDPALIGGAVIDAGDVVIDGSLRSKLARLQTALVR